MSSTRFLGVIINENLSGKYHLDMIKQKTRAALGAVMRIRSYLSSKAMLSLCHSLLLSHVRYCISNWCFAVVGKLLLKSYKLQLQVTSQKKCCKIA